MTTSTDARRRTLLGLGAALLLPAAAQAATPAVPAQVWKDAGCGCCEAWVAHLRANGFRVQVHDGGNDAARKRLGIDPRYGSCHTALIGGYAIEGHVPAREIHRLLAEKPAALGLAVPGMPVGSPGMDDPAYGGRKDPFDVLLLSRSGGAKVYQAYKEGKA